MTYCSLCELFTAELFGDKEKIFETTDPNAQARHSLSWAGVLGCSSAPPCWWCPRRPPSLPMPRNGPAVLLPHSDTALHMLLMLVQWRWGCELTLVSSGNGDTWPKCQVKSSIICTPSNLVISWLSYPSLSQINFGCDATLSQSPIHMHIHPLIHARGNLAYPIHISACFWEVRGNQRTQWKPKWTSREHTMLHRQ